MATDLQSAHTSAPLSSVNNHQGDAPVVRYLNDLITQAVRQRASDIHLEPLAQGMRVRWRIDGKLVQAPTPPQTMKDALISRVKILAKLDIAEKRLPQDGHIKHADPSQGLTVELRVNSLPTTLGEKVVIRLLDQRNTALELSALGMDAQQLQALQQALKQPNGMILITGPTGSGKTVTLYSCLRTLNRPDVHIATVEDPCEIQMEGATQVNVNDKVGLTFASSMRAFLRQDPDIIMVGEIRDSETADIAIKAAQTGHLVLSTLHANDAPATLSRLMNMGIPAYNMAASVRLIGAQRLLRRLCEACKQAYTPDAHTQAMLGLNHRPIQETPARSMYRAVGCAQCVGGYRGRTGVFQMMPVTDTLAHAMLNGQPTRALAAIAQSEGVLTLHQAAVHKALAGLTSIEEVLAHTRADQA